MQFTEDGDASGCFERAKLCLANLLPKKSQDPIDMINQALMGYIPKAYPQLLRYFTSNPHSTISAGQVRKQKGHTTWATAMFEIGLWHHY